MTRTLHFQNMTINKHQLDFLDFLIKIRVFNAIIYGDLTVLPRKAYAGKDQT